MIEEGGGDCKDGMAMFGRLAWERWLEAAAAAAAARMDGCKLAGAIKLEVGVLPFPVPEAAAAAATAAAMAAARWCNAG